MIKPEKRLLAFCYSAVFVLTCVWSLRAEFCFGDNGVYSGREYWRQIEVSRQGRFFATTDFADTGFDPGTFLAGRTIDKPGVMPSWRRPWKSDGRRTLFGVSFDQPLKPDREGQYDVFENKNPPFDRAVIWWADEVPAAGAWNALIRTMDGKLVKLNMDTGKKLYPYDHSTIKLPPVPIKTFYIGLKGIEDGLTNYVAVRNIMLFIQPDPDKNLTNRVSVVQPDFYSVNFSQSIPGMLDSLQPLNETYGTGVIPFRWMAPFIEYKGTNIQPAQRECQTTVETSGNDDIAEYTLSFDLPDTTKPVEVKVVSFFRQSAEKSVEFRMVAENLPEGAKLGYRFYCPESAFGAIAERTPVLTGNPIAVTTSVGSMKFFLNGAENNLALAKAEGLARVKDWFLEPVKWIKLDALASGKELGLAISLPVGSAGQPQPETLNYTWRSSLANEGDGVLAPFKMSDLELLEEIDCGNPADPHKYYDASNDPTVEYLKKKIGADKLRPGASGNQPNHGFLAFIDNPQDGAVPLETINGEKCRAIPDKIGSYFRYELKTHLKPRVPYLVAVEHAFDQERRGAFYSICLDEKTDDLIFSRGLYGAFEAEAAPEGGFRTEYVLCNFRGLSFPGGRGIGNTRDSIVFANKMHSGPWIKVPGLAVKSIRIYRVKTMPELPDLTALAPDWNEQRSVTMWTEMDRGPNTLYLFQYPKLMGYNAVWNHTRQFFGWSWRGEPHDWCHPGTKAGNEMLFAAAEEQGIGCVIHLGELLHLGFEGTDYDSFTDSITYMGERIPLKPTSEELEHIAGALKRVLPGLAKYRSLRDISTHFWPDAVITRRNLEDFRAATGAKILPSPSVSENVQSLLNGGPELLRQWQEWACAERFKFNEWLLAEVRKYRPDLFVTLLRYWDHGSGLVEYCLGRDIIPGADRRKFAASGISNLVDYLRFFGLDPALYTGKNGFMLELEAYSVLRAGKEVPDYFETDWFGELKKGFNKGGLGIMVHAATLEQEVPLQYYHCPYVVPKTTFRKGLIRAFVYGNPRNVTIGSYNEPWGPRLADFREFAVAYRMLPFVEPENYSGKITDTASQALISKYGNRYGLVNNGDKDTVVELELPAGMTAANDLSGGVPQKLEIMKNKDGKPSVKIAMKPWSLKTLEMK